MPIKTSVLRTIALFVPFARVIFVRYRAVDNFWSHVGHRPRSLVEIVGGGKTTPPVTRRKSERAPRCPCVSIVANRKERIAPHSIAK